MDIISIASDATSLVDQKKLCTPVNPKVLKDSPMNTKEDVFNTPFHTASLLYQIQQYHHYQGSYLWNQQLSAFASFQSS